MCCVIGLGWDCSKARVHEVQEPGEGGSIEKGKPAQRRMCGVRVFCGPEVQESPSERGDAHGHVRPLKARCRSRQPRPELPLAVQDRQPVDPQQPPAAR
jgi:hypothetical protein